MLRAVSTGRADLPTALARARTGLHDERDRALAGEIATGTLRWQGAFDVVIAAFAARPAGKLDPEVLDILRLTAFQLLHLDRVPASAAVNDAVNLARKEGKKSASGLVNAVLRRISRERARLPLPPRPDSSGNRAGAIAYLSSTLSHPEWLVDPLARSSWLRGGGELGAIRQRTGCAHLAGQHLAGFPRVAGRIARDARCRDRAHSIRSARPRRTKRKSPADPARRRRSLPRPG